MTELISFAKGVIVNVQDNRNSSFNDQNFTRGIFGKTKNSTKNPLKTPASDSAFAKGIWPKGAKYRKIQQKASFIKGIFVFSCWNTKMSSLRNASEIHFRFLVFYLFSSEIYQHFFEKIPFVRVKLCTSKIHAIGNLEPEPHNRFCEGSDA